MSDDQNINIFGIKVSVENRETILKKIDSFLADGHQHYVVTPNPEFLLASRHDEEFFYILNKSDLSVPDGFGLVLAGLFLGKIIKRYTGADLTRDILARASERRSRVAVLNWRGGLSSATEIKKSLRELYQDITIEVFDIDRAGKLLDTAAVNRFAPAILLVSLGAPFQEKIIFHNLAKMPSIKLAIGIGGALDFLTGKIRRAPLVMRRLGLEWFWRLVQQPRRVKRIYRAVLVFSWKLLKWRFVLPFRYRPNVACLMYKKTTEGYSIFIVERTEQPGHWQLPQGGIDHDDPRTAGARELFEEINCDKFIPRGFFGEVLRYDFDRDAVRYRLQKHAGYRGQKQSLFIAEFTGKDNDIKINFWDHSAWRWVDAERLVESLYPRRREHARIHMDKFWSIVGKIA